MYERKTIIKNLLKKYNKTYISVVENLDKEKAGCVSSCNFKVYFDVLDDSILIEDIITKENISVYYEFMSNDDLIKYSYILDSIFNTRIGEVYHSLGFSNFVLFFNSFSKCTFIAKNSLDNGVMVGTSLFEIKDTLKPINEYIAEIKKSERYIALMSKK